MPSYKTAFGSFLNKEDLQGKTARVVVASVAEELVKDPDTEQKEKKLVMKFVGKDKAMILNRTNCEAMETICGTDDYGAWIGQAVILFVDPTVKFGGKAVGGLRIRSTVEPTPVFAPPPVEEWDDKVPF